MCLVTATEKQTRTDLSLNLGLSESKLSSCLWVPWRLAYFDMDTGVELSPHAFVANSSLTEPSPHP